MVLVITIVQDLVPCVNGWIETDSSGLESAVSVSGNKFRSREGCKVTVTGTVDKNISTKLF